MPLKPPPTSLKVFECNPFSAQSANRHPEAGSLRKFRHPKLKGIRSIQLPNAFRVHLIFYRVESNRLVVFRGLHDMRDLPRRLTESPETSLGRSF